MLRAPAPPEAEYALFEIADIELRASEPGRVREHGYQTTTAKARARLGQLGITAALARDCALSMHTVLSEAYARGPAARHVARYLGATEVFQSDQYDPISQTYRGVFVDLPALVRDLDLPASERPAATLQAIYLAALLDGEPPDTTVFLSTDAWTKSRKPGERTHKRPQLGSGRDLASALKELARREPKPEIGETLARADVLAFLRARSDAAPDEDARALYQSLERAISVRHIPDRGPLSDPELWAIEMRLDANQLDGILVAVEEVERTRGRTPGTTYVRARASLALRLEPPKLVAERISALALSMTSFQELSLLAAEAWLDAGDARRALPYARDLVDAPGIDEGLLLRAQRLLARAVGAAPETSTKTYADSIPAAPLPPTRASSPPPPSHPPFSPPEVDAPQTFVPAQSKVPTVKGGAGPSSPPLPPPAPRMSSPPPSVPPPPPVAADDPPPSASAPKRKRPAAAEVVLPSARPPPLDLELTPPPRVVPVPPAASFTLDLPGPEPKPPSTPPKQASRPVPRSNTPTMIDPNAAVRARSTAPPTHYRGAVFETRPPAKYDPRAEPESSPRLPTSSSPVPPRRSPPPEPFETKLTSRFRSSAPPPPNARPTPLRPPPESASGHAGTFMRGATLPPYRTESPAPLLPSAPVLPRTTGAGDELVEHLPLPPGVGAESRTDDALPKSVLEARVQFTLLARELGLDYRLKRGIELRADVSGIEAMQSVLLESFPDHEVRTPEEAYEVRRHGALLSEILARRLDAEWLDITPMDLGYWAMIVPPDTRVWPFGRVARLITMGHRERDLVSYYLELKSRARGR